MDACAKLKMTDKDLISKAIANVTDLGWKVQKRALTMTKRYDYNNYDDMRDFLDELQDLSEKEDYYPDLTFSRVHVNVSIKSREEEKFTDIDFMFAEKVDALGKDSITVLEGEKNG